MKVILNYDYSQYPYTTASYLEMAGKKIAGLSIFRVGEIDPGAADLIINVMHFKELLVHPGVPSCYWEIDCHMARGINDDIYNKVDHVYIAQSPFLEYYPPEKTTYLPLGCDPDLHKRIYGVPTLYDIGFIGNDTYPKRRALLEQISTKYNLLRTTSPPGIPYSTLFSQCKMIFNLALDRDVNMRFFEGMAIGRLLLTDYLPAQNEFALRGAHYETYDSWEQLDKKIAFYLKNEKLRETIAENGAEHIRKNHTYKHRLLSILSDFGWKPEN